MIGKMSLLVLCLVLSWQCLLHYYQEYQHAKQATALDLMTDQAGLLASLAGLSLVIMIYFKLKNNENETLNDRRCPVAECGKIFRGPAELRIHERVHNGERPYHCNVCGTAYKTTSNYNRHLTSQFHIRNSVL